MIQQSNIKEMISENNLKKRIQNHLIQIYGDIHNSDEIYSIADNLTSFLSEQHELLETKKSIDDFNRWSEKSILLITYGDTILGKDKSSLKTLSNFLKKNCKKTFSMVHILPFFPSSSDHGFSVINYYTCLLYTSPSPRDKRQSRMPSSA